MWTNKSDIVFEFFSPSSQSELEYYLKGGEMKSTEDFEIRCPATGH